MGHRLFGKLLFQSEDAGRTGGHSVHLPFADVFHFGGSVREFHAAFAGVDGNTD